MRNARQNGRGGCGRGSGAGGSGVVLEEVCDRLERLEGPLSRSGSSSVAAALAPAHARTALGTFIQACAAEDPPVEACAAAHVLRAAAAALELQRQRLQVEIVWTGPSPFGAGLRRTQQALLDLIESAQRHLLVVMYIAYDVPEVVAALQRAAARGVRLDLVLETPRRVADERPAILGACWSNTMATSACMSGRRSSGHRIPRAGAAPCTPSA